MWWRCSGIRSAILNATASPEIFSAHSSMRPARGLRKAAQILPAEILLLVNEAAFLSSSIDRAHVSSYNSLVPRQIYLFPREALGMPSGWFRPGERVPVTGIFTARHDQHRKEHEVFAAEGERFPKCRVCRERVSFSLVEAASFMDDETGFGRTRKGTKKRNSVRRK